MTKKIKILMISLNLIGIAMLFFLVSVVIAIHTTHAFSMYREFEIRGIINKKAITEWQKSYPKERDYDIVKRMQQIGGVKTHLNTLAVIISIFFALNIIIILFVKSEDKKNHIKISSTDG